MQLKPYERCALLSLEIWIRWLSATIGTRWGLSRRVSDQQCDRAKTQRHAREQRHWRGLAGELQLDAVPSARAKVPGKRNASFGITHTQFKSIVYRNRKKHTSCVCEQRSASPPSASMSETVLKRSAGNENWERQLNNELSNANPQKLNS